MKKLLSVLVAITIFGIGCGGTSEPLVKTTNSNSSFPSWYSSFGFNSESSHFNAYGTGVSSSKSKAVERAELEARMLLESYIGKELEDIRAELERDGSSVVKKPDFILKLRNAQLKIQEQATLRNSDATNSDGVYRGFASVQISKEEVRSLIEEGLSSNTAYQREYINSTSFKEFFAK